jgi:hypothetical protein
MEVLEFRKIKTIDRFDNELNNHNSKTPAFSGRNLECGLMVVRK